MNYSKRFLDFCSAQERFEGGNNYTDTNPANIKCDPNKRNTWHHLAIKSSHNFCVFPDRATGILAHQENIYNICIGVSATYNYEGKRQFGVLNSGDLTIEQFISIYAPSSDGNSPVHYATVLCLWANLKLTDTMRSLLSDTPTPQNVPEPVQTPPIPVLDNRTAFQKFLDWVIGLFG